MSSAALFGRKSPVPSVETNGERERGEKEEEEVLGVLTLSVLRGSRGLAPTLGCGSL